MREGVFKPLTVDYAKTKRLLELGIITDEEAELYSNKFGSRSNNIDEVQISDVLDIREGDKILLCTDGLTDYVEDERIEDLLSMRSDSAYIANMLLSEAKKSGAKDDVTIMVIRVDQADASRITSYNVCYTKLLRILQPSVQLGRIPQHLFLSHNVQHIFVAS